MTKYYLILFIIGVFILFACTRNKSAEDLIVGDKGFNYWLRVDQDSILYFDYFDKNGKWLVFVSENGILKKHETPDDVIRTEKWYLQDDSTMVVGGSSICKLLRLTEDSMIYWNNLWEEKEAFVIAPDSLIPVEYQKLQ